MKLLFLINNTVVTMICRNSNGSIKAQTTKVDAEGKKVRVIINAPARMFEKAPEPKPKNDLSIPVSVEQLKQRWNAKA